MNVTILGSGTAVPSLERNSSGALIQEGGANTLIDFGYGTLKQLLCLGITYRDIDRIFFTHNHPDHMCDLIPFLIILMAWETVSASMAPFATSFLKPSLNSVFSDFGLIAITVLDSL